MKLLIRITRVLAVFIVGVSLLAVLASFVLQDKVAGLILSSFNKKISTKFTIGSTHLSFLKRFPRASLDLRNVIVFSSQDFDKSVFPGKNTDTLLSAKTVRAEFSIKDILRGVYNIDRLNVINGRLTLLSDTGGNVNYEISSASTTEGSPVTIDLERIGVTGISASYDNLATKLYIGGLIQNAHLKSRISGENIDFTASGNLEIGHFRLFSFRIDEPVNTGLDLSLTSTAKGVTFQKSIITLNGYDFTIAGTAGSGNLLDLSLTGTGIDISGLKRYLPEKLQTRLASYNPSGVIDISGKVQGVSNRTSNPRINADFRLRDGSIAYVNTPFSLKNLSFTGRFTNGPGRIPATSSFTFSGINASLGSSQYSGNLVLSDFDSLRGELELKGSVNPAEIRDYFGLKNISSVAGTFDLDLKMKGYIPFKEKYSINDFFNLSPVASLKFNSFGLGLNNEKFSISGVGGEVYLADTVIARDLRFSYREHHIRFDGIVNNLQEWLAGKRVNLAVSGNISCDRFLPEKFYDKAGNEDLTGIEKDAVSLPGNIVLDLKFSAASMRFKDFDASDISGILSYKPKLLNFKTLRMSSLDGIISGNGFLVQNPDRCFIGRGSFDLEKININKAFTTFHNFGQNFIKAENLGGALSGTLSVLIPADSMLKPQVRSVTAEGKYVIENGVLINFEPVKELSDFIELSELENIKFDRLQNDFFIRNNILYIPQMDVRSSAADLSVNGKHSFENNYEYHIKILLSEMLSRKIKKPKPNTSEFGAVSDDGLGRTSMLLKVVNKGEDVKVSYDIKAAGNQIKNDIRAERQNLRTILNEEYGWFKKDISAADRPAKTAPRFKIVWDESDTSKADNEPPPAQNEDPVRNLFRKKKLN